jgi:hypothetical protein
MAQRSRTHKLKDFLKRQGSSIIFFSLFTTTKWGGGKEEPEFDGYGKNHTWTVQDIRSNLDGSGQHDLPCHQPVVSSLTPQEDLIW